MVKKLSEKPVVVCAAIIQNESSKKILIAKRNADAKVEAGKWEFPGGKLEFGESPNDCLTREIKEELDLGIEVGELFDVVSHVYKDSQKEAHVVLLCYLCKTSETKFKLIDVADAKWISPSEFDAFDWAVADLPPLAKLKKHFAETVR